MIPLSLAAIAEITGATPGPMTDTVPSLRDARRTVSPSTASCLAAANNASSTNGGAPGILRPRNSCLAMPGSSGFF